MKQSRGRQHVNNGSCMQKCAMMQVAVALRREQQTINSIFLSKISQTFLASSGITHPDI